MPTFPTSRTWGRSLQRYFPAAAMKRPATNGRDGDGGSGGSLSTLSPTGSSARVQPESPTLRAEDSMASEDVALAGGRSRGWDAMRTVWLYVRMALGSLLIAGVMLAWPVGLDSTGSDEVSPLSFGVFQALYTTITFPVLYFMHAHALGALSWPNIVGMMLLGQLIVQGFFVAYVQLPNGTVGSLRFVRTVGGVAYAAVLLLRYTVHAFQFDDSYVDRILDDVRRRDAERGESPAGEQALLGADDASSSACSMVTAPQQRGGQQPYVPPSAAALSQGDISDASRGRVHSRAYVGADEDTDVQFARLAAFEDTSFVGSGGGASATHAAKEAGASEDDLGNRQGSDRVLLASPVGAAVPAEALLRRDESDLYYEGSPKGGSVVTFDAAADGAQSSDVFGSTTVSAMISATRLSSLTRDELIALESLYVASQLRCAPSAWFLHRWCRTPFARLVCGAAGSLVMWGLFFFVQWCAQVLFAAREANHGFFMTMARYVLFSGTVVTIGFVAKRLARGCDVLKTAAIVRRTFPQAIDAIREGRSLPASILELSAAREVPPPARGAPGVDGLSAVATTSFEATIHCMVAFFYAIFYRALFQDLVSWTQFAAISVAHLALLAALYPLRMTRAYFKLTDRVQATLRRFPVTRIIYDPSNGAQWNTRVSVDFMVNFITAQTAAAAFLAFTPFLRYGYNRDRYAYLGRGLSESAFADLMLFIVAGAAVEVLGLLLMIAGTRGLVRGGIAAPLTSLLRGEPRYQAFLLCAGAHVITDVFLAHVELGASAGPAPSAGPLPR